MDIAVGDTAGTAVAVVAAAVIVAVAYVAIVGC